MEDPYWKLRPEPPTPPEDICRCERLEAVVLSHMIGPNPIVCAVCNLEVEPERLALPEAAVDGVAYWRHIYSCFYFLWLDSDQFEDWARDHLADPCSRPTMLGYTACEDVSAVIPCYLCWFQDSSSEDFEPLDACPKCRSLLMPKFGRFVCESCRIAVWN